MGQALGRATRKVKSSGFESPPLPQKHIQNVERRPSAVPDGRPGAQMSRPDQLGNVPDSKGFPGANDNPNVLEVRDPGYDAMLSKMFGRISSKPGGKLEMGEAFILEKYNRPLPKLRTSKTEASQNEQKSAPPGTLDVVQLRQIILLHQGKSEEHQGPMSVDDIANKFRIDTAQVQKILKFVSLPPEAEISNKTTQQ